MRERIRACKRLGSEEDRGQRSEMVGVRWRSGGHHKVVCGGTRGDGWDLVAWGEDRE